jgi:CTP:molybdopterin cytidylyltransferase MocA
VNTKSSIRTPDHPLVAVLAAGRATRFGGGKLEALCAGKPLARWALDAVAEAGLPPGTLVTGPDSGLMAEGWEYLINPDPAQGLGSSLALAARRALELGVPTMLVLLADMPLLSPAYLRLVAAAPAPAATRQADGRPGVPALLDRALLQRATALTGDRGAGPLLADVRLLDAPRGTLFDVDTREDLAAAARAKGEASGRRSA